MKLLKSVFNDCSRDGHVGTHVSTSLHACVRALGAVFVVRACACVLHVLAREPAASPPVSLSHHVGGTAGIPKQPWCVRPAGIAASPGAPTRGAPTPNVEIPLERS